MHNIPIGFRNKFVAKDICGLIGIIDQATTTMECEYGSYIRVRVTLDAFQPLCRGRIIKLEGDEKVWVNFRYEHLPKYAIGVVVLIMVTRIVISGYKAKEL